MYPYPLSDSEPYFPKFLPKMKVKTFFRKKEHLNVSNEPFLAIFYRLDIFIQHIACFKTISKKRVFQNGRQPDQM